MRYERISCSRNKRLKQDGISNLCIALAVDGSFGFKLITARTHAALRDAGFEVNRVILRAPFTSDPPRYADTVWRIGRVRICDVTRPELNQTIPASEHFLRDR